MELGGAKEIVQDSTYLSPCAYNVNAKKACLENSMIFGYSCHVYRGKSKSVSCYAITMHFLYDEFLNKSA